MISMITIAINFLKVELDIMRMTASGAYEIFAGYGRGEGSSYDYL